MIEQGEKSTPFIIWAKKFTDCEQRLSRPGSRQGDEKLNLKNIFD